VIKSKTWKSSEIGKKNDYWFLCKGDFFSLIFVPFFFTFKGVLVPFIL
jgi:hypothetical protein